MKRSLSLFFLSILYCVINAQLNGNGYYRVQNVGSSRYVYVYDNTGSIDWGATNADIGAIQLWKGLDKAISDPASVLYIYSVGGYYNIQAQGTGVHELIGYYVTVYPISNYYQVYAQGKYLSDNEVTNVPDGVMGTNAKSPYRNWYVYPINNSTNNYFGVQPTLSTDGKYYAPFYAEFPFSFASTGMKAYYVSQIYKNYAIIKEIKDEVVPEKAPVLIECSSNSVSKNKLNLLRNYSVSLPGNLLKGVYFNNPDRIKSKEARTKYDASTMRVLGKTKDGKLGYIISKEAYLAANQSYLSVTSDTPDELIVITEEEFISKVPGVKVEKEEFLPIINLNGVVVAKSEKEKHYLPRGIYIRGGKKIFIH